MRIFIVLSVLLLNLFAIDATLEVIKKGQNLPTIQIEDISASGSEYSSKLEKMLLGDFKVSGHFKPQIAEYSEESSDIEFANYRKKGIDLLLRVNTKRELDGLLSEVRLYDINKQENVLAKSYTVSKANRYPFLSHKIAIDINDYIKAPSIDWMNKFVIFSRYTEPSQSDIIISDYTLTFQKVVVTGGLNIFPKWADSKQEYFYYTKYLKKPTLIRQNIFTGERKSIIESEGMLVCSDVSKDGNRLILTMAPDSQADIFELDLRTNLTNRLTTYSGIDVSGHYVDDEDSIIFISDRLGYPNIFQKDRDKIGVRQLVYHGKNNNACSAHDEYVVYSSRESSSEFKSNTFNLYLVSTKSDFIRPLTKSGINQFPKFSNDGETILFIKQLEGQSALGVIRLHYNKSFLFPLSSGKIQSIDW